MFHNVLIAAFHSSSAPAKYESFGCRLAKRRDDTWSPSQAQLKIRIDAEMLHLDIDHALHLVHPISLELREEERRQDVFSTMWHTYRSGYPRMEPYGYTDDSGWGCMLRSAQMLMTQALQRHSLGRCLW